MFTKVSKDPAVFVQMGVTKDELRNDTNPGFQARERQDMWKSDFWMNGQILYALSFNRSSIISVWCYVMPLFAPT